MSARPPIDHPAQQGQQDPHGDAQELDPDFADFLGDVVAAQEQGAATPRPEFGEVLRRAQGLDPTAVSDAMLDQATALASVVPLSAHRDPPTETPDPALDEFLGDVRAHSETIATERRLGGIPALAMANRPGQRAPQVAALVALAAAIVLLFVGTPSLFSSEARTQESSSGLMPWTLDRSSEASSLTHTRSTSSTPRHAVDEGSGPAPAEPAETGEVAEDPNAAPEDGASDRTSAEVDGKGAEVALKRPKNDPPQRSTEELEEALKELDAAAQRSWRQGQLDEAERSFRALIRRAPRGRWAQLAYGDLFSLARQRGDANAELKLWREYLKRHPKGPHADDAHAGICRRSPAGERAKCWRAYLEARPRGAYRQQALSAQEPEEADPE